MFARALLGLIALIAAGMPPAHAAKSIDEIMAAVVPRQGQIPLGDKLATLTTKAEFGYLTPEQSETFLVDLWGNLPGAAPRTLGMIIPGNIDPRDPRAWAIIISYERTGYVSDKDAAEIDYDALPKEMQAGTEERSPDRVKASDPAGRLGQAADL